ncbi:MAG TPA: hypothetical protein VJT50_11590 [Pyrinomonadaceae bacterium]|nr:hypothetical protein [Pyrinomonadaceae bacterium]
MIRIVSKIAAAILILQLLSPSAALACGPFSLDAIFTFTVHPEYPLENFARGNIGIVQPTYARSYLYVAYQYFQGNTFTPAEQSALVVLWRDRLDLRWESREEESVKRWLELRKSIPGVSEINSIEVYRNREAPNEYESYLNCQKDAFENAATTLESRAKKWGVDSAATKLWVEAQDEVFANCSQGDRVPSVLPADADALARADRQYQIASANFYAAKFDDAIAGYKTIESDQNSPWRAIAPYLIARTYLRKGSLGKDEEKAGPLTEAEKQLQSILDERNLKALHADSLRLLSLVRLRLHPQETIHVLANSLSKKSGRDNLKQQLWDYTVLLDKFADDESGAVSRDKLSDLNQDDLTDWLLTFQDDKAESLAHALERWRATSSNAWLIAALAKVSPADPAAEVLKRAASSVSANSPAYPSAAFYLVRLQMEANKSADARAVLDQLLREHRSRFNTSAINLLRQQRMLVAASLEDFLNYATRVPAGLSWNDDGREIPADDSEVSEEMKPLSGKPLFDEDAARVLNEKLPVSVLKQAAASKVLPGHLRRDVAQAAWLRAVILDDVATANDLAPTLKELAPDMSGLLDKYVAMQDPAAKKFAAIYAWLKYPGLEPVVDAGVGRTGPLSEQDSYRDNWWCSAAFMGATDDTTKKKPEVFSPSFLTKLQRAAAAKEYSILSSLGAAPNYIARSVVEYATKNPTDPRVPEALHLAVNTTRHGCTDKQTGRWSKAAYDFLHHRFPNNSWTKQTPYWFKD